MQKNENLLILEKFSQSRIGVEFKKSCWGNPSQMSFRLQGNLSERRRVAKVCEGRDGWPLRPDVQPEIRTRASKCH